MELEQIDESVSDTGLSALAIGMLTRMHLTTMVRRHVTGAWTRSKIQWATKRATGHT